MSGARRSRSSVAKTMSIAQSRLRAPRRRRAASTPQARKPAERQEKIALYVWSCRKSASEVLRRLVPQHDIVAANEDGENRCAGATCRPIRAMATPFSADCRSTPGQFAPIVDRTKCEGKAECVEVFPVHVFELLGLGEMLGQKAA
jgi:hypothetical protein